MPMEPTAEPFSSPGSYHVATRDHDAEMFFTESADFIARVGALGD